MEWEVWLGDGRRRFRDARNQCTELDSDFMESLQEIIKAGRGRAEARGLWVGGRRQEEFFIVDVGGGGEVHSMLFRQGKGEVSELVGVNRGADEEEINEALYRVLSKRAEEVSLLI